VSAWLLGLLWLWVAVSLFLNVSWRNPDPDWIPVYRELAEQLPAGEVGFYSTAPARQATYSYHALRYVVAPRVIPREGARPRRPWLVSDSAGAVRGYRVVAQVGGARLLQRQ